MLASRTYDEHLMSLGTCSTPARIHFGTVPDFPNKCAANIGHCCSQRALPLLVCSVHFLLLLLQGFV